MRTSRRFLPVAFVGLVLFASGTDLSAQASRQAEAQLKAAQQLEEVAGDLTAAMEAYRNLSASSERSVAARALVGVARCQQKLGLAEARTTLEDVIARFADQEGAALEARRLLVSWRDQGQAPAQSYRLVWTIPDHAWTLSNVSPDGHSIMVGTGDALLVRDLATGSERVVVDNRLQEQGTGIRVLGATFSRDGRQLAYRAAVTTPEGRRFELRRIDLTKPGVPPSEVIAEGDIQPLDWTRDGRSLVVRRWKTLADLTLPMLEKINPMSTWDVGVLSVDDGSLRILTTFVARYRTQFGAALSPDDAQLAVEIPEDGSGTRDIALLATTGLDESRAVEFPGDDVLIGWSPDGSRLLFSSSRGQGVPSLWGQRVQDGRPQGQPEMLRREGVAEPLGLTSSGALFSYVDNASGYSLKEAEFDFDAGAFVAPPRDVASTFVRSNLAPRWSPHGKLLGYVSFRNGRGPDAFVVMDLETRKTREIPLAIDFRNGNSDLWDWTPDSRSIVAIGVRRDATESTGGVALHRIDASNGEAAILVPRDLGTVSGSPLEWSADGKTLTYRYQPTPGKNYIRVSRDLTTGVEVEVGSDVTREWTSADGRSRYEGRGMSDGVVVVEDDQETGASRDLLRLYGTAQWRLGSDKASIVATTVDLNTNEDVVVVCALTDGSMRTVLRAGRSRNLRFSLFAPDERSVIVQGTGPDGAYRFWWVPLDGRASKPLTELAGSKIVRSGFGRGLELHPDGRRIAFAVENPRTTGDQIFVLENFLPAVKR